MSTPISEDPKAEYQQRLADRRDRVARLKTFDKLLSAARGIVFLAGLALAVAILSLQEISPWWMLAPVTVFLLLVLLHGIVVNHLKRTENAVTYFEISLQRLEDNWTEHGPTGERYRDPEHFFSDDLDLFGRGSLFQLLSTGRTRLGEDRLADWLRTPADIETVRARQAAVEELRNRVDLREMLAILDAEVHDELDQNQLREWVAEPAQPVETRHRILLIVLSAAAIAALVGWLFFGMTFSYVLIVLMAESLFLFGFRERIRHQAGAAARADSGLAILSQVLSVLEKESFQAPTLQDISRKLQTEGLLPSKQIARLHALILRLNNCLKNQFYAPFAFVLGLPVHLIHSLETWRAGVGRHLPDWLDAVAELEATSSLANYAYEHPDDPFPELMESGAAFDGEQLGHPLIPRNQCVRNDVKLGKLQLILVSGSNMSGKSTLLRTVGINTVLALSGAPVRAKRLRISSLQPASAMRIHDSLQGGRSLFYTAVSRIKSIIDLTGKEPPVLFLLDEVLMGTNSHDRRIGAEGIIHRLLEFGSIGLLTTHDLELTKIVSSLDSRAKNVHFEDQLDDGRMTFDYRLRDGVVQKSNALELMRMIGLDV